MHQNHWGIESHMIERDLDEVWFLKSEVMNFNVSISNQTILVFRQQHSWCVEVRISGWTQSKNREEIPSIQQSGQSLISMNTKMLLRISMHNLSPQNHLSVPRRSSRGPHHATKSTIMVKLHVRGLHLRCRGSEIYQRPRSGLSGTLVIYYCWEKQVRHYSTGAEKQVPKDFEWTPLR